MDVDGFLAGLRVLAVDDDNVCLKILEMQLRHCKYNVTAVTHAETALEMLRARKDGDQFDLVISDVHMPDMDGFKLLELVGLEMDIPVITLKEGSNNRRITLDSWNTFLRLLPSYRQLTSEQVRDGRSTAFWTDDWCNLGPLQDVFPALYSHCTRQATTVNDALCHGSLYLPRQVRITSAANEELLLLISALPADGLLEEGHDTRALRGDLPFTTGGVYRQLHQHPLGLPFADVNWENFAPKKVQVFFWILRHEKTRTRSFLHRIHCISDSTCPFCHNNVVSSALRSTQGRD
ncbi:hypothetical protein PR202_ga00707 [Eleusine coracana subsp. coracana]|uniref:Response regulatory domain-containing protein n=1 Tax=Eleusine coracana subsp. coracana TaxID=191504 RepID=A0AAV5BH66_ELECO|nr:hypothetical protein PR202_ga00707 [Eleusine coracana subsp. coracana]